MGMTRPCSRCSGGTETCVVGNFYTCSVCDAPKSEPIGGIDFRVISQKLDGLAIPLSRKRACSKALGRSPTAPLPPPRKVWRIGKLQIREGDAVTDIGPMRQTICPRCGCSKALCDTRFNAVVCPVSYCANSEDGLAFLIAGAPLSRVLEGEARGVDDPCWAYFAVVDIA